MLKVAVTGGIGSGKSSVTRLLAERGATVIDADALAREAVRPGSTGLDAVVEEFGPSVLLASGELDREALGRLVFSDADARRRLEAIVHPYVTARSRELMSAAPADSVVVYDVPLLVEAGRAEEFDLIVVVEASEDVRVDRLRRMRGMSEAEARARMASQASSDERIRAADVVINNDGSQAELAARVDSLWARLAGDVTRS